MEPTPAQPSVTPPQEQVQILDIPHPATADLGSAAIIGAPGLIEQPQVPARASRRQQKRAAKLSDAQAYQAWKNGFFEDASYGSRTTPKGATKDADQRAYHARLETDVKKSRILTGLGRMGLKLGNRVSYVAGTTDYNAYRQGKEAAKATAFTRKSRADKKIDRKIRRLGGEPLARGEHQPSPRRTPVYSLDDFTRLVPIEPRRSRTSRDDSDTTSETGGRRNPDNGRSSGDRDSRDLQDLIDTARDANLLSDDAEIRELLEAIGEGDRQIRRERRDELGITDNKLPADELTRLNLVVRSAVIEAHLARLLGQGRITTINNAARRTLYDALNEAFYQNHQRRQQNRR